MTACAPGETWGWFPPEYRFIASVLISGRIRPTLIFTRLLRCSSASGWRGRAEMRQTSSRRPPCRRCARAAASRVRGTILSCGSPVDQSAAGKCRHPARDRGQRVPSPATASCVADRVCPYRRRAAGSTAAIPSPLKRCTQSRTVWRSIPHWARASARRCPSSTNAIANVPRARGTGIAQRHWGVVGSWRQNAMAFSPLPRPDTSDVPAQ